MTGFADPMCHAFEEESAVSVETFPSSHSLSGSSAIPTIELSSTEDVPVETIDISSVQQEEDDCTPAIAVAELVANTVQDLEEGRRSTRGNSFLKRAEFISATFIKENKDTKIGIQLRHDNTIDSITPGSMASASPLQEGDRIFSINKRQCQFMASAETCDYLKNLEGRVTIVAHNKGGTASIVESMVAKQYPTERSGLVLKRVGNSQLLVSNIRPDKVFIDSLLNIGDEVLKINGISCTHLSPNEAAEIIKQTPKDVTVVARSLLETGVVVAEVSAADYMSTMTSSPARSVRLQQDLDRRRLYGVNASRHFDRNTICMLVSMLGCALCICIVFISAMKNNPSDDFVLDEQGRFPGMGGFPMGNASDDTAFEPTQVNIPDTPAFEPITNRTNTAVFEQTTNVTGAPTSESTIDGIEKNGTLVVNLWWNDEGEP